MAALHDSHQLASLHGRNSVFFCRLCGEVNAGGSLWPLWHKFERGTLPNHRVLADAKRAF